MRIKNLQATLWEVGDRVSASFLDRWSSPESVHVAGEFDIYEITRDQLVFIERGAYRPNYYTVRTSDLYSISPLATRATGEREDDD